jgi:hypothetical protein
MPTASVEAAQRWLREQANTKPEPSDTATLAAARLEKIKMETALLALKLARDQSNTELLPAAESVDTVRCALRFMVLALKARCEEFAEPVAAAETPNKAVPLLRRMVLEGWLTGAMGLLAQGAPEPRLAAMIIAMVKSEFPKLDDATLAAWMDSLCASADAKARVGL